MQTRRALQEKFIALTGLSPTADNVERALLANKIEKQYKRLNSLDGWSYVVNSLSDKQSKGKLSKNYADDGVRYFLYLVTENSNRIACLIYQSDRAKEVLRQFYEYIADFYPSAYVPDRYRRPSMYPTLINNLRLNDSQKLFYKYAEVDHNSYLIITTNGTSFNVPGNPIR